MVARSLSSHLPIVILLHHWATVFVNLSIYRCTLRVCRAIGQWQTYYLPPVLVKQDEHRLDVCSFEMESSVTHTNGLEDVLFFQELLARGSTGIAVMYPRSRIGPGLIDMPWLFSIKARYRILLIIAQRYITTYRFHFVRISQLTLHRRIVLPILLKGVDGATRCR